MKSKQFKNLRAILKRWFDKERRTQKLEFDALDANDEVWKKYHLQLNDIKRHIRRMYLMYPDSLFFYSSVNAINDWMKC